MLGVEPDPQMAAVARSHDLAVEVAAFEAWTDRGRRFDLITCAQAWHWIDPRAGAAKAAELLGTGGTLVLFWNFDEPDDATRTVVDEVYARLAPELSSSLAPGTNRPDQRSYVSDLHASGLFPQVTARTYDWQRVEAAGEWINRVATHSDHLLLGTQRLAGVRAALVAAFDAATEVQLTGGTYAVFARPTG